MRGLALVLFMLAALPMVLVEPFIGLLLWVLFSDMNPYREVWGFAAHMHWVQIISGVTLFSMLINFGRLQRIHWSGLSILLLLFLAWTGVTTATAIMHTLAVAKWIQFFKIQVLVFAMLMLVTDSKRLHLMLWVMVVSFGFWAAKGGVFTLIHGGDYRVMGPAASFYRDNNQFALVMCMVLPIMRYFQSQASSKWLRYGMWGLMGLTVLSIVGTYSRGGLITLAVVLFMLLLKTRKRFSLLLVLLVAVPVMFNFLPEKWVNRMNTLQQATHTVDLQSRIHSWEFATNVAVGRPFTGGGFSVWSSGEMWNKYGPQGAIQRAIHSIFFEVLGEQGFIGLSMFLLLLVLGWRNLGIVQRLAGSDPEMHWMKDLAAYIQVGLVGYIVAGTALPQAYFNFTYQILALTIILRRDAENYLLVRGRARIADKTNGKATLTVSGEYSR